MALFTRLKRFYASHPRLIWWMGGGLGVWLLACLTLGVVVYGYGQRDEAQPANVIVVLGGGINPDMMANEGTTRRARRAADLWKAGYAPVIVCSGGYTRGRDTSGSRSEAAACADVLRANGVPDAAIVEEDRSRSTEENAIYTHALMDERGWQTALVVSDGYHLLRARWIFSLEGVNARYSPAAEQPSFFALMFALAREVAALHWQLLKLVLNLPFTYVA